MTLSAESTKELIDFAEKIVANLILGHDLLIHQAIQKIKELLTTGKSDIFIFSIQHD